VANKKKPEVLPALPTLQDNPELAEVSTIAASVTSFLAGLVPFFAKAAVLEGEARSRHQRAMAFVKIATSDQQAEAQALALKTRDGADATAAHWQPIAKVTNRLHKCVTGARGRAEKLDDEAFEHLNTLNNRFNAEQKRLADAEAERVRLEAEEAARAQQAREAADLERQALEAEQASEDLSEREQVFVREYVRLAPDATTQDHGLRFAERAAAVAGYKSPVHQRGILLAMAKIQTAIQAARNAIAMRQQAAAVMAAPVVVHVDTPKADVATVASTATRWKAKCTDRDALMAAVKAGAVPDNVFMVDPVKLNEYAKALQGTMNNWPGVEAWDDTRMRR
jgi:hypothetical protein